MHILFSLTGKKTPRPTKENRNQKIGQAKTLGGADNVLIFNQPLRVNSVRLQNKLESQADC